MNTPKRSNWKSGLAVVAVLALCIATASFGQSPSSNHGPALGLGKLEAALEVLDGSAIDPNATAGVIVQFLDDDVMGGPAKTKQELKKAAKEARKKAIADAGGTSEREFDKPPRSHGQTDLRRPETPGGASAVRPTIRPSLP